MYVLGKTEYESLDLLLKKCSKQLKAANVKLNLKKPVSAETPFEKLLAEHAKAVTSEGYSLKF